MKDNFSLQADEYKKYRPKYPKKLFTFLTSIIPGNSHAWDCGTGNGQVAQELAFFFDTVSATDISSKQIENATPNPKISFSIQKAEKTSFPDATFDLITVAQAIHWFDFDEFYKEVYRTLKVDGIITVVGYGLMQTFKEGDDIINRLYNSILGPFWDEERKYIDEHYQTIPFPFKEIEGPKLKIELNWTFEQLINYLGTWSAVQHYKRAKGQNPVDLIYDDLKKCWSFESRTVEFPLFLRIGKVLK